LCNAPAIVRRRRGAGTGGCADWDNWVCEDALSFWRRLKIVTDCRNRTSAGV